MFRKFVFCLWTLMALHVPAFADTCPADVTRAKEAVKTALDRKPDRYRGKFKKDEFDFIYGRTPVRFATPTQGEDWITRGSASSVDVNSARFCTGLSAKEQARWLFHGYLNALGAESTDSTGISQTFKTVEELTAFVCDLSFYLLYEGNINPSAMNNPSRAEGYGEELADAWNEAVANAGSSAYSDHVACYEIGYRPGSYNEREPYCSVRANFTNSCQRAQPRAR